MSQKIKPELDTLYNDMVSIIYNEEASQEVRDHAKMLLSQYATAGGKELTEQEVLNWAIKHSSYIRRVK